VENQPPVTDGNKANGQTITNSNTTQALLDDLEARGYKLSVNENGNLCTDPKGPPITPVIWHALQANYGRLKQLLTKDVTDSNVVTEPNVRKDNTDWSRVADLKPARGEEMKRAIAEYRQSFQAASEVVKAAAPENPFDGMMMLSLEADKRKPARDREAQRRIEAAKKGGLCAKCGRALKDGETVYTKVRVYAGMWGGLTSHPGPRYEAVSVCGDCAPEWMADPDGSNEYTIAGKTIRVPHVERVVERACATCERPVVYQLTRRDDYKVRPVFCSYRCEYTYHNRRRSRREQHLRQKVCEVCAKEFTATRAHTKTCSPACKQKAYRERNKAQAEGSSCGTAS
jgi:hypothetical protein